MRLYTAPLSMFGMKVEIAAYEKGLTPDIVMVPFDNARGYDPKDPTVVRINPKRQVPVLIDGDVELYDSTQIFEYLEDAYPDPPLWPKTVARRAVARQLEHASDEIFFPLIIKLMGLQDALNGEAAMTARAAAESYYLKMEALLDGHGWLADNFSFTDIALFMAQLFAERLGAAMTEATPKLAAWRQAMLSRPSVQPVMKRLAAYLDANNRFVPDMLTAFR